MGRVHGVEKLYQSPQSGPLVFWTAATLLRPVNTQASRAFANRGLTCLMADDFHADCRPLLEGDSVFTQCLANLAAVLRDLEDADVEGLAILLQKPERDLLYRGLQSLRAAKEQPLFPTLTPALDDYWNQALKARVRSALMTLAMEGK